MAYDRELEALEIELDIARQQLALLRVLEEGDIKARISELEGVLRFRRLNGLRELAGECRACGPEDYGACTCTEGCGSICCTYFPEDGKLRKSVAHPGMIHTYFPDARERLKELAADGLDFLEEPPDDVGPYEGKDADADDAGV